MVLIIYNDDDEPDDKMKFPIEFPSKVRISFMWLIFWSMNVTSLLFSCFLLRIRYRPVVISDFANSEHKHKHKHKRKSLFKISAA